MEKTFRGDIEFFYDKLVNKENFGVTRFGDGELVIVRNNSIDLTDKNTGEFKYNPDDESDSFYREQLINSLTYKDDNYYVGCACPCCIGTKNSTSLRNKSEQKVENMTWANIFVNSNYNFFMEKFVPIFDSSDTYIVCNKHSDISNLPFKIKGGLTVGTNAWKNDYNVIDDLDDIGGGV